MDPQSAICSKPRARCDPSEPCAVTVADYHARPASQSLTIESMVIDRLTGLDGAGKARGFVVVIDVLRSFTVSAYALAGGARECLLVSTIDAALALHEGIPGSLICAEEGALPVPGIPISNSPTQIHAADVKDRVLIQRSSAGTTVMSAVETADELYAASLVVAKATAEACLAKRPEIVTLIASADHPEDHACSRYIEGILRGEELEVSELLRPLRESDRFAKVMSGTWPGFPPTDLDLSLVPNRFDFAMPATRVDNYLRLISRRAADPMPRPTP
jgi:2-phosphosulfolactate phosphatase